MLKFTLMLCFIIIQTSCSEKQASLKTDQEGKLMPSFNLLLIDSTTQLNTNDIPIGEPIVMFYFNPHCPYCKAQTESLMKSMSSMSSIKFYFFSSSPLSSIRKYAEVYQLQKHPNIFVGKDTDNYFSNYYKTPGVPYLAIYGKDKHLKKAILGKVGINLVKDIAYN